MENQNHIEDLIIANATGNISEEERRILFEWKSESQSNLKEYNRLVALCKRTDLVLQWNSVDVNSAEVLFKKNVKQSRVLPLWLKIAASIIIVLSVSLLFTYQSRFLEGKIEVADIVPGKSKAVLTLSDGRSIDLGYEDVQINEELVGVTIKDKASGKITYDRISDGSPAEVRYNTIKVPTGGEYQLVLSDGTKVWLNSETTLKYPVTFVGGTREVMLVGEAYFEVAHNNKKPFFVKSESTTVKVLGTSFNYKAYRGEKSTEITLAEGKINVAIGKDNYILVPGKQAKIDRLNKEAKLYDVDVDQYVSWTKGVLQFVDMPMEELVVPLSRWYNVEFEFSKEVLKYERFSGAVTKYRDIKYLLDLIEETNDIKFEIKGKKIFIKGI